MKTKTITKTFYVSDVDLKDISQNDHLDNCEDILLSTIQVLHYKNEIQISWQEPEKKIEITESEFDEYVKDFFKPSLKDISPMNQGIKMQTHLKQKLFGAER